MTTTELATAIGTDARTLRKFLRSEERNVGKGSRYDLPSDKRTIAAYGKRFASWDAARKADKTPAAPVTPETPETDA